ncbi:glycosyltransferase family 39 protein [candidate division KSB1 bacterium]|nr:glycosyltransferase family 39 protein [candidate division KSB1 bacterium]
MKKSVKIFLLFAAGLFIIYLHLYGIDKLVLGSDELHPARALISDDWSLTNHPWPEEAVREYYDNWPIQFPPLFGLLSRASVVLFGVNAFALRIFPAIFALLAVLSGYFLFRLFMKSELALAVTLAMGMASDKLLIYAKSLKHYTADVLMTILLIYWGKRLAEDKTNKTWLFFTISAAVSIWLAFASIYSIAAIYLLLFIQQVFLKKNRPPRFWLPYILSGFVFCLSFAGLYIVSISRAVTNPVFIQEWLVQIFHWDKITDISYILHYFAHMGKHILLLPAYYFFDSVVVAALGNLLIIIWIIGQIKRKNYNDLLLLTLPLIFVLLASFAGKYPFSAGRLTLFLMPLWLIMIVLGFKTIYESLAGKNKIFANIVLFFSVIFILQGVYVNFIKVKNMKYSGGRRVDLMMYKLKEQALNDDTVYLHWGAILPFYFYFTDHQPGYQNVYPTRSGEEKLHIIWGEEHTIHPERNEPLFQKIESVPGRLWIAFGHQWPAQDMLELEERLDSGRRRLNEWEFKGCKLLLYAALNDSTYRINN